MPSPPSNQLSCCWPRDWAGSRGSCGHVITDLGWPVSLLGLALGALERTGSSAPVYFSGYDRGYESAPFPRLYDPRTAGEVSPLLSAFEAAVARPMACVAAEAFPLAMAAQPGLGQHLLALSRACAAAEPPVVLRAALDDLSWSLLAATLSEVARPVLARAAQLGGQHQASLSPEHQRLLAAVNGAIAGRPRVDVIDRLRDFPLHLP